MKLILPITILLILYFSIIFVREVSAQNMTRYELIIQGINNGSITITHEKNDTLGQTQIQKQTKENTTKIQVPTPEKICIGTFCLDTMTFIMVTFIILTLIGVIIYAIKKSFI